MSDLLIQQGEWKKEKHLPVIEAPACVKAGEYFQVKVTVGKEIPHPNTTEHHISWIDLYFQPEGSKFPHQIGHFAFTAHGEAVAGPNQGPAYTAPFVTVSMMVHKPGTFHALEMCNIHGLWESNLPLQIEE